MRSACVLRMNAAKELQTRKWGTGQYYNPKTGRCCLLGVLALAAHIPLPVDKLTSDAAWNRVDQAMRSHPVVMTALEDMGFATLIDAWQWNDAQTWQAAVTRRLRKGCTK